MPPRFAAIDVGTNTVLLLVADASPAGFVPVVEREAITRLGRGVDRTARLDPEAIVATLQVLEHFATEARALGAQATACVATSAARDAGNGPDFLAAVRARTGLTPEIISGELEAELCFEAAVHDFGLATPLVTLDIGGGSTEFVFGAAARPTFRQSFALGSVRLTERHLASDPPTANQRRALEADIDRTLTPLPAPPPGFRLVALAGTATTAAAVALGVDPFDAARVHGLTLGLDALDAATALLFRLPLSERRRLPGMVSGRADVLPAGAALLVRSLRRLGATEVVVSDRGLRWGLLQRRFGHATTPPEPR